MEEDAEEEFEDDLDYLRSLDPKDVKNQDHYRVLGLAKQRLENVLIRANASARIVERPVLDRIHYRSRT